MLSGVKASHGLTPKQELFCQLVARGQNLSDSYREAYASTGNANTVNQSASKLWSNPKVWQRVEDLCRQASNAMMRDSVAIRRHVFSRLLAESQDMRSKPSERISALLALGRIDTVGMFRELHAVERLSDRPPEEIERELNDKLNQFLIEAAGSKRNGTNDILDVGVSTERDTASDPVMIDHSPGTQNGEAIAPAKRGSRRNGL